MSKYVETNIEIGLDSVDTTWWSICLQGPAKVLGSDSYAAEARRL